MKNNKNYKADYAKKMVAYFKNAPFFVSEKREVYVKKSDKIEVVEEKVSAPCPSFVRFADEFGLKMDDLKNWRQEFVDFAEAYKKAKLYQEDWLMNAAGLGFYNSSMSIMALKANHGWVEKQDAKNRLDAEITQVLVEFVREKNMKIGGECEEGDSKDTGGFCSVDDEKV